MTSLTLRRGATIAAAAALVAAAVPVTAGLAATSGPPPVVAGSAYLALGDSIAFGYRESSTLPGPVDYSKPGTFRGYPQVLASSLGLRLTDAACPGETSTSFRTGSHSNGCEDAYDSANATFDSPGYRTAYPLHTSYGTATTQMQFAKAFLSGHPGTRLVTLTVGANDGFLCQHQTSDGCVTEFSQLLSTITANVGTILGNIRKVYKGQLVVVDYFSTDYTASLITSEARAVDSALADAAAAHGATVASAYNAFQKAAVQAGGNTCTAGLLTLLQNSTSPCGVHTSPAGAAVLATAVAAKLVKH